MKRSTKLSIRLVLAISLTGASLCQANDVVETSYGETVGRKATQGISNLGTAFIEIPKNVIIDVNQYGAVLGTLGGFLQGVLNFSGRTVAGLSDFILAPIPTQPAVEPNYVWQDFSTPTSYDKIFQACSPESKPCKHQ